MIAVRAHGERSGSLSGELVVADALYLTGHEVPGRGHGKCKGSGVGGAEGLLFGAGSMLGSGVFTGAGLTAGSFSVAPPRRISAPSQSRSVTTCTLPVSLFSFIVCISNSPTEILYGGKC